MPGGQSTNPFQSNNPYKLRRLNITWNDDRIWRMVVEVVKSKSLLHNDREDSCLADFKAKNTSSLPGHGEPKRDITTDVNCQNLQQISITKNKLFGIQSMEFVHEDGNTQVIRVSQDYLVEVYRKKAAKKFLKSSNEVKVLEDKKSKLKGKSSAVAKTELQELENKFEHLIEMHKEQIENDMGMLLIPEEQVYEVRQEIYKDNYLEFDFFPLDIKFNKNNLEDFIPGDLNKIEGNRDQRQESVPVQQPYQEPEETDCDVVSNNSDDVEVAGLGKDKGG